MEKFAHDHDINTEEALKSATVGFATGLGSPASTLSPTQVKEATSVFTKRASERRARHESIRGVVENFLSSDQ